MSKSRAVTDVLSLIFKLEHIKDMVNLYIVT